MYDDTVTFEEIQQYLKNWESVMKLDKLFTPQMLSGGYTPLLSRNENDTVQDPVNLDEFSTDYL